MHFILAGLLILVVLGYISSPQDAMEIYVKIMRLLFLLVVASGLFIFFSYT